MHNSVYFFVFEPSFIFLIYFPDKQLDKVNGS